MNTPHPHAEFIAEAVKYMSRGISKVRQSGMYEAVSLFDVINDFRGEFIFFFDDTPPVKPKITSPLTIDEIRAVFSNDCRTNDAHLIALAIEAKIATIREIAAMAFDTSLLECNGGGFSAAAMRQFADAAIAEFQKNLLAGIGE